MLLFHATRAWAWPHGQQHTYYVHPGPKKSDSSSRLALEKTPSSAPYHTQHDTYHTMGCHTTYFHVTWGLHCALQQVILGRHSLQWGLNPLPPAS